MPQIYANLCTEKKEIMSRNFGDFLNKEVHVTVNR